MTTTATKSAVLTPANAATKEAVFDALARAELSAIVFSYCFNSGSDIGEIENIEASDKNQQRTEINPMIITAHRASPGVLTPVPVETDILDAIKDLCTVCFSQARGRWGKDEAGYGQVLFDVSERTIRVGFQPEPPPLTCTF